MPEREVKSLRQSRHLLPDGTFRQSGELVEERLNEGRVDRGHGELEDEADGMNEDQREGGRELVRFRFERSRSGNKASKTHKNNINHPTKLSPAQILILRNPARRGRPKTATTS